MREDRTQDIKSIFLEVHLRDDTIDEENMIAELMRAWKCSRKEITDVIDRLELTNYIFSMGKRGKNPLGEINHRLLWLNPEKYQEELKGIYF